jgi:hypothetical protein
MKEWKNDRRGVGPFSLSFLALVAEKCVTLQKIGCDGLNV